VIKRFRILNLIHQLVDDFQNFKFWGRIHLISMPPILNDELTRSLWCYPALSLGSMPIKMVREGLKVQSVARWT